MNFLDKYASLFDILFSLEVVALILISLLPAIVFYFKHKKKKALYCLFSLFISAAIGVGILMTILIVSLALSLLGVPSEYGLSLFIFVPLLAIIVNIVLLKIFIKRTD